MESSCGGRVWADEVRGVAGAGLQEEVEGEIVTGGKMAFVAVGSGTGVGRQFYSCSRSLW